MPVKYRQSFKPITLLQRIKFLEDRLDRQENMYRRRLAEKDLEIERVNEHLRLSEEARRELDLFLQKWVLDHPEEKQNGTVEGKV